MPQANLRFLNVIGSTVTFIDPQNIDNKFSHLTKISRRTVGPDRIRQVRSEFSQVRNYGYKPCKENSCAVNDFVSARVILSGATPEEVIKNWNDIKANVDIAISKQALSGVPLAMNTDGLIITVDAPKP